MPVGRTRGHDGDARRKHAQGIAKFARGKIWGIGLEETGHGKSERQGGLLCASH